LSIDPYLIRLATSADLAQLALVEQRANAMFADTGLLDTLNAVMTPVEWLREAIALDRLWVAVASDDQPVGFALATTVDGNAHLDELDVDPAHGRRGLGSALVETVCAWAHQSGFPAITLTTLRHIPWNAPFYEKLGFRILEAPDQSDAQRQLLHDEIAHGLPAEGRVIMRRDL
jgi:GNAT superfamily N-acetyltransferase